VWLVVGLGNPGKRYERTRHNIGFDVVNELCRRWELGPPRGVRFGALVADGRIGHERASVVLPQKFMNRSGGPTQAFKNFYDLSDDRVVVVHDDVDVPFGQVRCKSGGGHGGHNGLRDIIRHSGRDFVRVRCGVGRPPEGWDTADYVLGKWNPEEQRDQPNMVNQAADAVEAVLGQGVEAAMNRFNVRPKPSRDAADESAEQNLNPRQDNLSTLKE
jgi:PTH1 family peptidyl-tRNA hydrolase